MRRTEITTIELHCILKEETNIVPLKVMYDKGLEIFNKKSKGKMTNGSENYKRDDVSLVLSKLIIECTVS